MKPYRPSLLIFGSYMALGVIHCAIAAVEIKEGAEPRRFILMIGAAMLMFWFDGMAVQSWVLNDNGHVEGRP